MLHCMEAYSLYLHIPFCQKRCSYCDFNTFAGMQHLIPGYVAALQEEIRRVGEAAGEPKPVHTIFFGGGTPSLLSADQFKGILTAIQAGFAVLEGAEITLEANPGTVNQQSLSELAGLGFNRISFGVQSFQTGELRLMGRIHSAKDALQSVEWAREVGFDNLNLDLIFGLPGQTMESWEGTLGRLLEVRPEHVSLYALTVEEGTDLSEWVEGGLVQVIDDDLAADMYETAGDQLERAGYQQYEISNWALPGRECRHNLQYWRMQPYLGLGAAAHGYVPGRRMANVGTIGGFIQRIQQGGQEDFPFSPANESRTMLSAAEERGEFMMVGLRLTQEGISEAEFKRRFGLKLMDVFGNQLVKLVDRKLLEWIPGEQKRIRLTKYGRLLGNQVFVEFV